MKTPNCSYYQNFSTSDRVVESTSPSHCGVNSSFLIQMCDYKMRGFARILEALLKNILLLCNCVHYVFFITGIISKSKGNHSGLISATTMMSAVMYDHANVAIT